MLQVRIVSARTSKELQEKANAALAEISDEGNKVTDTDVAGRASESGTEWIMTIVYENGS